MLLEGELIVTYVAIGLFGLAALLALVQIYIGNKLRLLQSSGFTYRRYFLILLAISNLSRGGFLYANTLLPICDQDMNSWLNYLANGIPSLLYFTTLTVLILFFAHMYYHAISAPHDSLLRPTFLLLNLFAYGTFIALAILTHSQKNYGDFRSWSLYIVGTVYIIGGLGLMHFGTRILVSLSVRKFAAVRRMLIRRLVIVNVVCTFIFISRGIVSVLFEEPVCDVLGVNSQWWDAIYFMGIELLPSLIILWLLRVRAKAGLKPTPAKERVGSNTSHVSTDPSVGSGDRYQGAGPALFSSNVQSGTPTAKGSPRNFVLGDRSDSDDEYHGSFPSELNDPAADNPHAPLLGGQRDMKAPFNSL